MTYVEHAIPDTEILAMKPVARPAWFGPVIGAFIGVALTLATIGVSFVMSRETRLVKVENLTSDIAEGQKAIIVELSAIRKSSQANGKALGILNATIAEKVVAADALHARQQKDIDELKAKVRP